MNGYCNSLFTYLLVRLCTLSAENIDFCTRKKIFYTLIESERGINKH